MYCSWNKYCIYFLLRCGLRSRCSVSWEKWNTKKLCLKYIYNTPVIFSVQACQQLVFKVLFLKQVLFSYLLRCGLRRKFPESQRNLALTSVDLEFYTVQFEFFGFSSFSITWEVSNVFIVVVSSWKWPKTKRPEMPRPTKIKKIPLYHKNLHTQM